MSPLRVVLGVGATKAGTSWLHETLAEHPEVNLRSIKELHFFDSWHDRGMLSREIETHRRRLDEIETRKRLGRGGRDLARRLQDRRDWLAVLDRPDIPAYLEYLADGARGRLVGDVTPAYALCDVATLRHMAEITEDVRAIYIMRDPVERLWSHVRMIAARRAGSPDEIPRRSANILRRVIAGREEQIAIRCDYAGALKRLKASFASEALLVAVYEDMFSDEGLGRICRFLGIEEIASPSRRVVHGGVPIEMTGEQERMARDWLAPQYDEIARMTGGLPRAWQANMARV